VVATTKYEGVWDTAGKTIEYSVARRVMVLDVIRFTRGALRSRLNIVACSNLRTHVPISVFTWEPLRSSLLI
jgi:hypothetical protein